MVPNTLISYLLLIPLLQATLNPTPLSGPQPSFKPGNHQEDSDAYVDYKTCSVEGLTYWSLLDEALRDPHHKDRTDGLSTFQKYYTGIFDDTVAVDPDAYQDFLDHSLHADQIDISTSAEKGKTGDEEGLDDDISE
ncbi:MAG: hypothetical protein Q9188_006026 [Gyalolechia gomerana]